MGLVNNMCLKWWCIPTASMQQRWSWQPDSRAPCQQIYRSLCNPRVHYHIHNTSAAGSYPRPDGINSHPHILFILRSILVLSSDIYPSFPQSSPFRFLTKMYTFLVLSMKRTCCLFYPLIWSIHTARMSGMHGGLSSRRLNFLARCYGYCIFCAYLCLL